jgi:glycogen synthase
MRVLHLTTEFPPVIYGGLGTAVGGLVEASAAAGIDVGVLLVGGEAGGGYGSVLPLPADGGPGLRRGDVHLLRASYQEIAKWTRVIAAWRPQILHLHSFWLWSVAESLRRQLGVPLVYTVPSLDRAEYELGEGPPECLSQWVSQETVIRGADRIIALTQSERELLMGYCPDVAHRVRVVGNGIDVCAPRARQGDIAPPVVLFSGRFVERKGVRELMEAIVTVLDECPGVQFVLAGGHRNCTGAEMEAWLLPAALAPRRSQILFTGWQSAPQMRNWYRAADILVVPSWYEPFGMVVLEGMVHGVAVAASAIGGPLEILEHERTGILFRPRDACALASAIVRLVKNPTARERLVEAARDELCQKWLWPKIVEKMRCVYEELSMCAPEGSLAERDRRGQDADKPDPKPF